MSFGPVARLAFRLARAVVSRRIRREAIELLTNEIEDLLQLDQDQAQQRIQVAISEGQITQQQAEQILEQQTMVDYPTFAGIVVDQCPGTDFGDAARIWNREKQQIKQMTIREVRENLQCP